MLDLGALRDTLSAALDPIPVAGAADFAAIVDTGLARAPALWLIPLQESAELNALNIGIHQRVTVRIGVIYAVRQVRDATGQAAADELSSLRTTVFTALLGQLPDPSAEPFSFHSGGLVQFVNSLLFWQDQFQTRYTVRAV